MSFSLFMQHLANGVSLGSLYALIAIGYTMVYGILRLINFAHGDIVMVGAYVAFYGIAMFLFALVDLVPPRDRPDYPARRDHRARGLQAAA